MKNYTLYNMWPGCYAVMVPYFLAWVEETRGFEWQVIFEEPELVCHQFFETIDEAAEFVVDFFNGDGEELKLDLSR